MIEDLKKMITCFPDTMECVECGKKIRFPYMLMAESENELADVLHILRKHIIHFCKEDFIKADNEFRANAGKYGVLQYRLLHNEDSNKDLIINFKNQEEYDNWFNSKKKSGK